LSINSVKALSALLQPGDHARPSNALLGFSNSFSRPKSSIEHFSTFPVIHSRREFDHIRASLHIDIVSE